MKPKMFNLHNRIMARTYKQKVACLIGEKYSLEDEIAIIRQRDTKPEEFAEYNKFCEECKTLVKNGGFSYGKNA